MVEESNAASHSLASEARSLFDLVAQFKTGGTSTALADRSHIAELRPVRAARGSARVAAVMSLARYVWTQFPCYRC